MIVRCLPHLIRFIILVFQFHYGMIVSAVGNPTKQPVKVISIPLWDDCEDAGGSLVLQCKEFQFHYGMIVSFVGALSSI